MNNEYHPVTEKELDMIKNDCAHPETESCDGCECWGEGHNLPCSFIGANALMDEVLTRPDPLEILEAWRRFMPERLSCNVWDAEYRIIKKLRENPEMVMQQGIEEGWWKK